MSENARVAELTQEIERLREHRERSATYIDALQRLLDAEKAKAADYWAQQRKANDDAEEWHTRADELQEKLDHALQEWAMALMDKQVLECPADAAEAEIGRLRRTNSSLMNQVRDSELMFGAQTDAAMELGRRLQAAEAEATRLRADLANAESTAAGQFRYMARALEDCASGRDAAEAEAARLREALAGLVKVLRDRHYGRMPDVVQAAYDAARAALEPGR